MTTAAALLDAEALAEALWEADHPNGYRYTSKQMSQGVQAQYRLRAAAILASDWMKLHDSKRWDEGANAAKDWRVTSPQGITNPYRG
jgi:hypothetical protein